MKAIVHSEFGPPDVLRLEDVEKPSPGDDEVLIRVRAASINPLDWVLLKPEIRRRPRLQIERNSAGDAYLGEGHARGKVVIRVE